MPTTKPRSNETSSDKRLDLGKTPGKRGFAALNASERRAVGKMGGRAVQLKGTAHKFTSEEARSAGQKGGQAVSRDRKYMSELGRRGGMAKHVITEVIVRDKDRKG